MRKGSRLGAKVSEHSEQTILYQILWWHTPSSPTSDTCKIDKMRTCNIHVIMLTRKIIMLTRKIIMLTCENSMQCVPAYPSLGMH